MIQQSQHLISNRLATNDRDSLGICGTQLLISQSVRVEPPEKQNKDIDKEQEKSNDNVIIDPIPIIDGDATSSKQEYRNLQAELQQMMNYANLASSSGDVTRNVTFFEVNSDDTTQKIAEEDQKQENQTMLEKEL